MNVSKAEAVNAVRGVTGCTAVSIDIVTEPTMKKTGNPYFGNVVKHNTLSGLIGFNYEHSVSNQLGREEKPVDFVSQPRAWGTLDGCLVLHKGKVYLQVKVQATDTPVYTFNGEVIDVEVLCPFLPEHRKPHTQDALDKEVIVRDVSFDNIRVLRMLGEEYILVDEQPLDRTAVATDTSEQPALV